MTINEILQELASKAVSPDVIRAVCKLEEQAEQYRTVRQYQRAWAKKNRLAKTQKAA